MIKDLQEFGQWLDETNNVSFNNIKNDDYILIISYADGNFFIKNIQKVSDANFGYFEKSLFSKELQFSSNQNYVIANNSNLMGLSPFFVKIGMLKNDNDINTFKRKAKYSKNQNKNKKQFIQKLNEIYADFENNYLNSCKLPINKKNDLKILYNTINLDYASDLVIDFYSFVYENLSDIITKVQSVENYKNINFYMSCIFGDIKDLFNDLFFYYCKYMKKTNDKIENFEEGVCSICGNNITVYPSLSFFSNKSNYFFNNNSNIEYSPLQICNNCNSYIKFAFEKLENIIKLRNILIIPKKRGSNDSYDEFIKISNKKTNSFEKINDFLLECKDFSYDLVIYEKQRALLLVNKYIENYKAFLLNFENLYLFEDNQMNYIYNDSVYSNKDKRKIRNTFDFEEFFRDLFIYMDNDRIKNFNQPFYVIYSKSNKDIQKLLKNFDSNSKSIFMKYYSNIFNFVYELNLTSINKQIINEIVLNSICVLEKNKQFIKKYNFEILKRLNFYFLFRNTILGDEILLKNNIKELTEVISSITDEDNNIDEEVLITLFDKDPSLKYFILGQFIKIIDDYKGDAGKNVNIFSNFISHVNRNNIKKYFVTEVLQKNNFYINQFEEKEKFIFRILKLYNDILFNEEILSFEDYLLFIFTGYYCKKLF